MAKIQSIKNKIDGVKNLKYIENIVEDLSEIEAKTLLKLYIYSK